MRPAAGARSRTSARRPASTATLSWTGSWPGPARSTSRVLLVIDDLHHLLEPTALAQLELLLDRRPAGLRLILSTRHDPPLGLHRLRLAGDLVGAAGGGPALRARGDEGLARRPPGSRSPMPRSPCSTPGPRAGSPASGSPPCRSPSGADAERFVAEFSGSERTVADYLFAEVLQREPEPVRRPPAADVDPRAGERPDRRPAARDGGVGGDPARSRGLRRLRLLDRPRAVLVPLPQPACGPPAPRASAHRAPQPSRTCITRPPSGSRSTGTPSTPSGMRKPQGTGATPAIWSGSSGSASRSTARSRRCARCSRPFRRRRSPTQSSRRSLHYGEVIRPSLDTAASYIAFAEQPRV